MSDTPSALPEVITVAEQAKAAGQRIRHTDDVDDIDTLKTHCLSFINHQGHSEALAMSKTKLEEMILWLRRHRERQSNA
jgi:hypothetical protein